MSSHFESYIKECNLWTLRAMLTILEERLGTAYEKPDDLDRTQLIAHQINNLLACRESASPAAIARKMLQANPQIGELAGTAARGTQA